MRLKVISFLFAIFASLVLAPSALAQFETGTIVGTVKDASGALVPNASVTVTNTATGVVSTRTTNADGNYEVPGLRVGQYDVVIVREGFASSTATGVPLSIAARQRVDLVLNVGTAAQTVDVSAVNSLVETDTSQRGQIVTNYQTSSLPLVSRNYSDLLALSTGVRAAASGLTTTATTSLVREGAYNVNGQRSIFNNFLLDGMDNNAYGESNQGFSNQIFNPPPDSIAQLQVVTNNQSAEYGRASGATFNVAYRSGTNQFHGLLYEFIRNTSLNAIGFFRGAAPVLKPQFNRNQFGGNFGGPVLHDKLFFFVDYEAFRQARKQVTTGTLPTATQRAGTFGITVYDPYNGTPYAAGTSILNSPNISPIAKQVFTLLPANTNTATTSNYTTLQRSQNYSDKGTLRLDYQLNPKSSAFVRVSDLKQDATDFPLFPLPIDGSTNGKQRIHDEQIAVGYTRVIGANQLLDARLGLSRTRAGKYSLSIGDKTFSFPGLPTDPTVAGGLPSSAISGGFSTIGRQSTNPQFQNPILLNPKVNYSYAIGRHSIKTGYEYQHIWMAVQDTNPLYGSFAFAGAFSRPYVNGKTTAAATQDNYVADYLFGASSQYGISTYFVAKLRNQSHYAYVQDDWKITPQLTINAGVRYEYGSPYYDRDNRQSNFDPTLANGANPTAAMVSVTSNGNKYGIKPDKNDFAPRLGFAYAPNEKTSVRGGYGISYVHYSRAGSGDILAINAPQALFLTFNQTAPQAGGSAATYRKMDTGFPSQLTFNPITANITYIDSNRFRDSYVHSYYMAVQRQLAKNTLIDVAYVGNYGLKLLQFANFNQAQIVNGVPTRPIPTYGDITIALHEAYSHYDSLQVRYEQRMVAGLTLLNSFTYSHTLDNAGASLESNTPSPQDYYNLRNDYSNSEYNQPLVNTTSVVYELPFGRGKKFLDTGGVVNQVIGNWQISAINQSQSGLPFNLLYNPGAVNQVSGIGSSFRGSNLYRPNVVPGKALTSLVKPSAGGVSTTSVQYVNIANNGKAATDSALALPYSGATGAVLSPFGSLGRNAGRSPNINYLNLAVNKRFETPIERLKVEFRSELYNVLNHTNFAPPSTTVSGTISATNNGANPNYTPFGNAPTAGGNITATFDPRIVQFGLKLIY